jgi:uncharacterized protein (TIGR02145 family)
MRYSIFTLLMVLGWVSLGQSKKEQIRVLTNRVDSLNLVLNAEKSDNSQRVEQLNRRVSELEENVRGLEIKLKEKDSENETNKKQIEELRKLINVKSDSLMVLKVEVEKLKPTPKPVVQNNTVVATPPGPYKTVTIGSQVWMTKNLDVSTFRNGDPIPEAKTNEEWEKAGENQQPAWCYYDNDTANGAKYGKLYNWYAVNDSRGLAPIGYYIPSDAEWTKLNDFLGGEKVADTKMKSKSGWAENGNGTNSSGFSGLPGGHRSYGSFFDVGENGFWWSSTENFTYLGSIRKLYYDHPEIVYRNLYNERNGFSVRCLRD